MKEEITKILIERGYPKKQALSVACDLQEMDNLFQTAFQCWLNTEEEQDFQIEGFKLSEIKQKFSMTYPAALLTMDSLIKEPELAKECINRGIR